MEKCNHLYPSKVCSQPIGLFLNIISAQTSTPNHCHQTWTRWTPSILFHPPRPRYKSIILRVLKEGVKRSRHLNNVTGLSKARWTGNPLPVSVSRTQNTISVMEAAGTCCPLWSLHLHKTGNWGRFNCWIPAIWELTAGWRKKFNTMEIWTM